MRALIAFVGLCVFAASAAADAGPVAFTAPVQGKLFRAAPLSRLP
jgi:hypothetical protein